MFKAKIDCTEMETKLDFMRAMDKAFGFPPYFGENWDALWDCMRDLYWIKETEIVLEIENSDYLFGKLKTEIIAFFEDLKIRLNNPNHPLELKRHFDFILIH